MSQPTSPAALPPKPFDVTPITIEEEMKSSYLDYAMSVIVSRALPDVRDGLKPVHRRILYGMNEAGYDWNRAYRKSARIVGDVMGKYHPHGDAAIYDSMVRMAQEFSMRLELIDGQGNFGSMDGDPPAAMRYTEARLHKAAAALLADIDKETVEFGPNYDDTTVEPSVLPAQFPNLLVNGGAGIAVGMATNIPTHNLGEVIDACCAYIDNPEVTLEDLMAHVPGPDFPTGGIVLGKQGILEAYRTGRGSIVVRSRCAIEEIRKDRQAIVVSEIPYQVNKARLVERIAEVSQQKLVEGISDLRDESDRDGVRIVIELSRTVNPEVVLNQLYRHTPLQTSFGINMLALNGGRPELLGLREVIQAFIAFREEVITKRTRFELRKARERAHILIGLAIAVVNLDPVIKLIREAPDPGVARQKLIETEWPVKDLQPLIELVNEPGRGIVDGKYRLSEEQAKAILDLRLHRLTGLERDKIADDLKALVKEIEDYLDILASRKRLYSIMRGELTKIKEEFPDKRKTELAEGEVETDIEDLIQPEDMVVTVTHGGYIKRVPLSTYRAQRRGGRGRAGMATRDEDFLSQVFVANTHTPMLFFSSRGMVYQLKVFRLPLGTPQARGKAMINILPLAEGETISTLMPLPADESKWASMHVMFATSTGNVRRNALSDFLNIKANGKIAMKLEEGERLIGVATCGEDQDVLLSARSGKCIRFHIGDVRVFAGRTSTGVRGIKLENDDVISMTMLRHTEYDPAERAAYLRMAKARRGGDDAEAPAEATTPEEGEEAAVPAITLSEERFAEMAAREDFILTVTANGFGKRSSAYEYRVAGRGGKGIANIEVTKKNGEVVASFPVRDTDQIMLVTNGGQLIRTRVNDIRIAGRKTQGVTVFKVADGERVMSVTRLSEDDAADGNGSGNGHGAAPDAGGADNGAPPEAEGEPDA
ncbi:MAG TPA: DNA gyrase subunit A [Alphaproteobacteria bacterium]|nr:DNA gyrase subunit A [Alphaproteobacteria bacterium]